MLFVDFSSAFNTVIPSMVIIKLRDLMLEDLSWTTNNFSLEKKAQQHLFFLRQLKKHQLSSAIW